MSDAQKIATVLPEVKKVLAAEEAAKAAPIEPVSEPIAAPVLGALGLDKPAEPPKTEEQKKAGYVDISKLAPKKEGYAPDTDNKKFFDFVQDRYRAGSLGVAPGYNFYSDSPLYNDKLVEEYKARYPELAAEYAANPDAGKYSPVVNPSTENKHELAGFWDYAAGRQEKDDLRNLYMYGFKSDDPRANPEIMQRLKDENPWLWDEYNKYLADQEAAKTTTPAPGDAVPPEAEVPKPAGANGNGKGTPAGEEKKELNLIGILGKLGYSALEILQAGLAGRAGNTNFDETLAGRRVLTEKEAKAAADKKAETAEERAFQEKLIKLQDENDTRRMMADQTFQSAMKDKDYTQAEKMAVADQARELEKMGYDRETAIILADKAAAAAVQTAGIKAGTDPLALKGMDTLDALFQQGKITAAEYEKQKGGLVAKAEATQSMANKLGSQAAAEMIMKNAKPNTQPEMIPGTQIPKSTTGSMAFIQPGAMPAPPTIEEQLASAPSKADKQKILMAAGFKEMPGSGGLWQGPAVGNTPGKVVRL